jgi:hypothetical protein
MACALGYSSCAPDGAKSVNGEYKHFFNELSTQVTSLFLKNPRVLAF